MNTSQNILRSRADNVSRYGDTMRICGTNHVDRQKGMVLIGVSMLVSRVAQSVSVWIRTGRPGDRGSIPVRGERIFPLASVSRPNLGPTQHNGYWGSFPWG
jgi:hypothetical protein